MSERKRIEIDSLEELKQLIEEKDEDTMLVISLKKEILDNQETKDIANKPPKQLV